MWFFNHPVVLKLLTPCNNTTHTIAYNCLSKFCTKRTAPNSSHEKTRTAKISNSCQHSTARFAEYERMQANNETALMPIYYSNCCEVQNSYVSSANWGKHRAVLNIVGIISIQYNLFSLSKHLALKVSSLLIRLWGCFGCLTTPEISRKDFSVSFLTKSAFSLSGDGFYRCKNVPESISAWASPRTPVGELTEPPSP